MHSLTSLHGDYHSDFQFMELTKHNPKPADNIEDNMMLMTYTAALMTGGEDFALIKQQTNKHFLITFEDKVPSVAREGKMNVVIRAGKRACIIADIHS